MRCRQAGISGRRRPGRPRKTIARQPSDDALEAPASSAPPTSPRMHMPSQGISLGSADTDGSDDGGAEMLDSELRDFIVDGEDEGSESTDDDQDDDDEDLAVQQSSAAGVTDAKRLLSVSQEEASKETAVLPDVLDLGKRKRPMSGLLSSDRNDGDDTMPSGQIPRLGSKQRARKVVEESDSDDD